MIAATGFRGETVAVMGLGRSGCAAIAGLLAGGAQVVAWDDDRERRGAATGLGAEIVDLAGAGLDGIAALVLSPGIPHHHPRPHPVAARARAAGVPVIGDIELLVRARPDARIIGISGTNGKSTTTALIGHILATAGRDCQVGGNIGQPVLDLDDYDDHGLFALELSSYQLELTPSLACAAAVMLNVSPDHLDRHGGLDGYVAAKRLILDSLPSKATAVIGVDDPTAAGMHAVCAARSDIDVFAVSGTHIPKNGIGMDGATVTVSRHGSVTRVADLASAQALPGSHNAQNACAATAVALSECVPVAMISAALLGFPGLPHRQETVGRRGAVVFVNDSKATNAEATARALACYDKIYWIAGGLAKAGGIASLSGYFPRIRHVFLIGNAARSFATTLDGAVAHTVCNTLECAVAAADAMARRDGCDDATVLLSPAAASFDQFASFEARGDRFRRLVHALAPGVATMDRRVS